MGLKPRFSHRGEGSSSGCWRRRPSSHVASQRWLIESSRTQNASSARRQQQLLLHRGLLPSAASSRQPGTRLRVRASLPCGSNSFRASPRQQRRPSARGWPAHPPPTHRNHGRRLPELHLRRQPRQGGRRLRGQADCWCCGEPVPRVQGLRCARCVRSSSESELAIWELSLPPRRPPCWCRRWLCWCRRTPAGHS